MDFREKKDVKNPYETTNFFSRIFFIWTLPFLWECSNSKKEIKLDDIYNVPKNCASKYVTRKLNLEWEKEVEKHKEKPNYKPKFLMAFYRTYKKIYTFFILWGIFNECFVKTAQMLSLLYLIRSFSESAKQWEVDYRYYYAGGLILTSFIYAILLHLPVFESYKLSMKVRVAICSMIYQKALKLSKKAERETNVGQLVNLLSNDVLRFDPFFIMMKYFIIAPLQAIMLVYFLWKEFGNSCLPAVGFIILLAPLQYYIAERSAKYREEITERTDERGRIMNEIIIAIRVIKMYAWEKPFGDLINRIRRLEMNVFKKTQILKALYFSLYTSCSKVMILLTVVAFVYLTDETLRADKVFFALAIFESLRLSVGFFIPAASAILGETLVSMNRLETFFLLDEKKDGENLEVKELTETGAQVLMKNVEASWTSESITLDNLTMKLSGNTLVTVVGQVGCGKTSLLNAILSELPITGGKCIINGLTSYASQEPWIFTGNVRQNILFGLPYNEKRYHEVVHACALLEDFKQLPFGEFTIVGERGVSLSGGQKARINLARAVYKKADIYLLDDPLSAVDARVSRHIYEECIKRTLDGHLRILVTHQLQYLHQADHVIVLNEGKLVAQGTYNELVEQGIDFVSLMANESEEASKVDTNENKIERENEINAMKKREDFNELSDAEESREEKMAGGSVTWKTYWQYFKTGGSLCGMGVLLITFILSQVLATISDYWLSYWTNKEEHIESLKLKMGNNSESFHLNSVPYHETFPFPRKWFFDEAEDEINRDLYIYTFLGMFVAFFFVVKLKGIYFYIYSLYISINLHNRMFSSIVRAPVKFFDENPSGRIMNRFTKDMGSIDDMLVSCFFDAIVIMLQMVGVLIIVIISNYLIIIPSVFLFIILYFIRKLYINAGRVIKRYEAITRSPVFTHITASIQGLTTLRALRAQEILINQFDSMQDVHSSTVFSFISTTRWFGIWMDLLCVIFLIIVIFSFTLISNDSLVGNVGLAISSTLNMTALFQWGIRQTAETENFMISVERALEYAKLTPEAPLESKPDKKPPKTWPEKSIIQFQNVFMSYEENNFVLKDLTFQVMHKEKIGIIGRTGAGKSSIVAALFRMTEPTGDIIIDGVNIREIGLHDLRNQISIIPQDPVLFSGTIRYNLDPFNQFKDDQLWKALEEANLKKEIPALDYVVSDGGSNFSVGQRQLVCLARSLLKQNKIIVLDEATANVDPETDSFIQKTIRKKFAECSIITIAHRLHSVIDCDKILVLDNGYLKEYDHPYILLQKPDGHFTSMVKHTGKPSSDLLKRLAKEAYSDHGKEKLM